MLSHRRKHGARPSIGCRSECLGKQSPILNQCFWAEKQQVSSFGIRCASELGMKLCISKRGMMLVVMTLLTSPDLTWAKERNKGLSRHDISIRVAKRVRVSQEILSDEHTLLVVVDGQGPTILRELSKQLGPGMSFDSNITLGEGREILLQHRYRITDAEVYWKKGRLELRVFFQKPVKQLQQRIVRPTPKTIPSAFIASRFVSAEEALKRGEWDVADRLYRKVETERALQGWARLRLIDLGAVANPGTSLCDDYRSVADEFKNRTSGLLAIARMLVLDCAAVEEDTLRRVRTAVKQLDGVVGGFLWSELLWALAQSSSIDQVELALKFARRSRSLLGSGVRAARRTLLARAIRLQSDPLKKIRSIELYRREIASHIERFSLLMSGARAARDLDLPRTVMRELDNLERYRPFRGPLWKARKAEAQIANLRGEAYKMPGTRAGERAQRFLAQRFRKRFGVDPSFSKEESWAAESKLSVLEKIEQLEVRLRAVDRAVSAVETQARGE